MTTWQPPIPAGALYSKPARQLGPALALLAYCYDLVQRDGWIELRLKDAAGDMQEPYPTVKRWWQAVVEGKFFAQIEDHGRKGWRVRFKDVWLDWRILETREPSRTNEGSEMILEEDEEHLKDISRTNEGSEMILEKTGIKVLISTDQASVGKALNAPRKQPEKRRSRDPNQQHPACLAFHEKTGYRPNRQQAADIAATVTDLVLWDSAVAAWLGKGHRITDAKGMIDWYLNPARFAPKVYTNGHTNGTHNLRQSPGRHSERGPIREADPDRDF